MRIDTQKKHKLVAKSEQQKLQPQSQSQPRCQYDLSCTNPTLIGKSPFCKVHAKQGPFCSRTGQKMCKGRPLSGWEPNYMPSFFNGIKNIQYNHNCFAYAFDVLDPPSEKECIQKDGTCIRPFHQPGYASGKGKIGDKKYCPEFLVRLKGDMPDIDEIEFTDPCKQGFSKIAIVIDPNNDYHFYRQDSNGLWSHKPGGQAVTNLDASNKLIFNPELCNRDYRKPGDNDPTQLNYSIFCSFLQVPRNKRVHAKRGGGVEILETLDSMKGGAPTKWRLEMTRRQREMAPSKRRRLGLDKSGSAPNFCQLPLPSANAILGSCVVLPDPVSPQTITTWCACIADMMSSRRALTGRSSGNSIVSGWLRVVTARIIPRHMFTCYTDSHEPVLTERLLGQSHHLLGRKPRQTSTHQSDSRRHFAQRQGARNASGLCAARRAHCACSHPQIAHWRQRWPDARHRPQQQPFLL
jgi:hypothetical protein